MYPKFTTETWKISCNIIYYWSTLLSPAYYFVFFREFCGTNWEYYGKDYRTRLCYNAQFYAIYYAIAHKIVYIDCVLCRFKL